MKECGGPLRGSCDYGRCNCKTGYQGDNCGEVDCNISAKKCLKDGVNKTNTILLIKCLYLLSK